MPGKLSPKQEKIWNYKKKQVSKQTGKKESQFTDVEWRRVNFLFQKAKKKYKGKLPKKYSEAGFKQAVMSSYQIIITAVKPPRHKCAETPSSFTYPAIRFRIGDDF
jgi:hypothetical protein